MKFGKVALIGILALSVLIFTGPDLTVYAKGGGGSSSSSRSSSSSFSSSKSSFSSSSSYSKPSLPSSSSGYSKPTTSTWGGRSGDGVVSKPAVATSSGYTKPTSSNAAKTPAGSSGYTKPSSSTTTATTVTAQKVSFSGAGKSTFDKGATTSIQRQKSAESLSAYKAEQSKFKQPEKPFDKNTYANNGLYKSAPVYSGYSAKTQITVRNNYYGGMGYSPPMYYTSFSPSYGVFDTMFMFWMLDSMHTNAEARAMAHNYRNDPGYQQWRRDADKQADTNAELKAKLASMDAEMAKLKDQPVNPNYVPKGIPSEAIVAPQAMMAKTPATAPLVFASGQKSGKYFMFAEALKGNANTVGVKVEATAGSMENLKLLIAGKADMALVQSDALAMFDKEFPNQKLSCEQTIIYPEYMQLIVNSSSGIKSINDMLDGKTEVCFPKGSGSAVSWDALCEKDPKYKKIPVRHILMNSESVNEVAKNSKLALFLVAGLNAPAMQQAEKIAKEKGTLQLASIEDTHMLDKTDSHGNKVYTYYEITKDTYPALQKGWWFFKRDVKTLGVDAVLVLRTAWVEQYGQEALEALTLSVLETKSEVDRTIIAKR
jgi:TRAP transporter TAXI family solute receptor